MPSKPKPKPKTTPDRKQSKTKPAAKPKATKARVAKHKPEATRRRRASKPSQHNFDAYTRCLDFMQRMQHHMQYDPEVNKFKLLSYRNAIAALQAHGSLNGLSGIKGIGKSMLAHIETIQAGKTPKELKLVEKFGPPFSVNELTRIQGVGAKKALDLYETYKVKSLENLGKLIAAHKISDPKLIAAFYDVDATNERISRNQVAKHIEPILGSILEVVETDTKLEIVGSYRRYRPDIRDIDVLIGVTETKTIKAIVDAVKPYADSVRILDKLGDKKAEVLINIAERKRKLDLYFIEPRFWGSALLHFTGPGKYNILVREFAKSKGLKVSQYGVSKDNKIKRFADERSVCEYIGIPYLDPECRDAVTDVKAMQPDDLVMRKHIRGDLHIHTKESDGLSSTDNIIKYLLESKLKFVGISNHSQGSGNGLSEDAAAEYHAVLRGEKRLIKCLLEAGKTKHARILVGAEVDIRKDGKLDYSSKFLKSLDYCILSIHHQNNHNTTQRYLDAIALVSELGVPCIIAHPTTRIIGYRVEAQVDWYSVFKLCAETNTAVEINGQGDRMDLPDSKIMQAVKAGCVFALSSDFHGKKPSDMKRNHENAVMLARRGGVTRSMCINTSTEQLKKWLGESRYSKVFGGVK